MQGAWVQSLVGELRSHILCNMPPPPPPLHQERKKKSKKKVWLPVDDEDKELGPGRQHKGMEATLRILLLTLQAKQSYQRTLRRDGIIPFVFVKAFSGFSLKNG